KILGFARDLIIAAYFGTSRAADAFNFAYLFTGNIFVLLGGLNGPFHSAVVSALSHLASFDEKKSQTEKKQNEFLTKIMLLTSIAFVFLSLLIWLLAKPLIAFLLKDYGIAEAVYKQLLLMLPVFFLSGLIGILFGAVSYKSRFFWPAVSPILSSLALIGFVLLGYKFWGQWVLGIGTSLGAVLQTFFQFFDLLQSGFKPSIASINTIFQKSNSEDFSDIKYFNFILFPALLSSTIGSLNVYVDSFFCAKLQEGSWTAILMANRLIQLPFGILVGSSLVSFLPRISLYKSEKTNFIKTLYQEIFNLSFLLIPATALLIALSHPLVELLFQRGEFTDRSTDLVNLAILGLGLSMLTALPREIYTRAFYALGDSKTPLIVSLISIFWNAILDWVLCLKFQVAGIALSTTLTALINSMLLIVLLKLKHFRKERIGEFKWFKLIIFLLIGSLSGWLAFLAYGFFQSKFLLEPLNFINLNTLLPFCLAGIIGLGSYVSLSLISRKF
ncbi:MAG: murein biosynthesis integral membrane protein MurJ, partial [Candidatus Caenarcaniphilales bacterium]|nr:murein biosynthesis integral membrane protein MurJ [Candidatus Caenarcaniphilales bacterium]